MTIRKSRLRVAAVALCCTVLIGATNVARAQSDDDIEQARQKGIEFLKSQQQEGGNWEYTTHTVGITALATLALLENGLPVSDSAVDDGYQYVRRHTSKLSQTYDISLAILLLSRMDEQRNRKTIRDLAARLIVGQLTSGGWSYKCPVITRAALTDRRSRPEPKTGYGDNSCTQFAVLGLWTASRIGVEIDKTMRLVEQRLGSGQLEDGGWSYREDTTEAPQPSKNSMTFAGLFCLTVAKANELRNERKQTTRVRTTTPKEAGTQETLMENPVFSKGFKRAEQFVKGNSGARYYLWSVERLSVLLGLEEVGEVDWFNKGADILLKAQKEDGSWPDAQGGISDTSFAILFLRKANLGSDISRLLRGEPLKRFQIPNREGKPRFDTFPEALRAAESGDTIRVEADGPFRLPHIEISKTLTIEAGAGYTPVFQYDIGYNDDGTRSRPSRDPDVRHMLRVSAGELTLEGLKLEMDPPAVGKIVEWAAIELTGGSLRMLNCSISEGNKKGMAGILLTQPGSIAIRNSTLVGGRAAIELVAKGKQEIQLDNTLLFSNRVMAVLNDAQPDDSAELTIHLADCILQGDDAFDFDAVTTPIHIDAKRCAFKTTWIGRSMLAAQKSTQARSYTGEGNVYHVSKWIGYQKQSVVSVRNAKTWTTFWGDHEQNAKSELIALARRRPNGVFSHRIVPQDWEVVEKSQYATNKDRFGIWSQIVGVGTGFTRFRESIMYNQWKQKTTASK